MLDALGSIEGKMALDLFAGSGSLGIEALSRGAAHVNFVEQSREACTIIAENLARLGFSDKAQVFARPVERYLDTRLSRGQAGADAKPYGLVFMDAPYRAEVSNPLLKKLAESARLGHNATICVGHHRHESMPEQIGRFARVRQRCFGASCISIYQAEEADV